MKIIVILLALMTGVAQAGDDFYYMLQEDIEQQVDTTEVVFVRTSEWNAAIDRIYSECEYIGEDFENIPDIPYIFQCNDWAVYTNSPTGDQVTLISIEGIDYIEDKNN